MQELDQPRTSHVFQRGNYQDPGAEVRPGTPSVLHALPDGPPNRLTLARWLIARDNPLTARVAVNRWWAELFGGGIVSTVEDFGIKGEDPTHVDRYIPPAQASGGVTHPSASSPWRSPLPQSGKGATGGGPPRKLKVRM